MGVAGLDEEVVEDVAETAAAVLRFRVWCVGLEDEHFDGVFGHFRGERLCFRYKGPFEAMEWRSRL